MVQRLMGGPEFSIDLLCDLDGRCLNVIPRTMIESRGGESIKGTVIADPELIELGRAVGEALGVRGPCTVQAFRDPEIGLGITDVNTRFGGAFAEAGVDVRDPEADLGVAEGLHRARPAHAERLADARGRARSAPGRRSTVPLIDSPPRDSIIVRGITLRQRPSRSPSRSIENSGPPMSRWTITGSLT